MNAQARILIALALAFLFQIGALGWMIAERASLLRHGETIVLDVEPYDPRDLFLGHYLRLNLPLPRSLPQNLPGGEHVRPGAFVHIVFEQKGGRWEALSVDDRQPDAAPPRIVLRAKVERRSRLRYGIERYYLPQADAVELGSKLEEGAVQLVVAVSKETGRAAIKRLLVEGEPRYEDPLF